MSNIVYWIYTYVVHCVIIGIHPCPLECSCVHSEDNVSVNCSNMELTEEPDWTLIPHKSTKFDVSRNLIKTLQTPGSGHLRKLAYMTNVSFSFNLIEMIPNNWLKGMKNLKFLFIDHNEIFKIEKDSFEGLQKLEALYLGFNDIRVMESTWFINLESLYTLSVENNSIANFSPEEEFTWPPKLTKLNLINNKIASIPVLPLPKSGGEYPEDWEVDLEGNPTYCGCKGQYLNEEIFPLHAYQKVKTSCLTYDDKKDVDTSRIERMWSKFINMGICKTPDVNMSVKEFDTTRKMVKCSSTGFPQPQLVAVVTLCGLSYTLDKDKFDGTAEFGPFHYGSFSCEGVSPIGRSATAYHTNRTCDGENKVVYSDDDKMRMINTLLFVAAVFSILILIFIATINVVFSLMVARQEEQDVSNSQYLDLISSPEMKFS